MWQFEVPNAPCGVERVKKVIQRLQSISVPNAPCGVESVLLGLRFVAGLFVPNAPCGVESRESLRSQISQSQFLMHRVELKADNQILPS